MGMKEGQRRVQPILLLLYSAAKASWESDTAPFPQKPHAHTGGSIYTVSLENAFSHLGICPRIHAYTYTRSWSNSPPWNIYGVRAAHPVSSHASSRVSVCGFRLLYIYTDVSPFALATLSSWRTRSPSCARIRLFPYWFSVSFLLNSVYLESEWELCLCVYVYRRACDLLSGLASRDNVLSRDSIRIKTFILLFRSLDSFADLYIHIG